MSDTELKFGPEWMRQLSHGGGLAGSAAPPCQPSLPANKNKPAVAEHRYSKEKMLELCARMEAPPEHLLNDPAALCGDQDCTVPLAFTSLSQDEQRMWQRNINSDSALRFMANGNTGRGGGGVSGGGGGGGGGGLVASGSGALSGANSLGGVGGPGSRGRGGSMDRGRGRARGGPGQYYMRGLSYEEDGETGARGGGSRELAPPGIAMRRGGGFERSTSLSSGVGLSGGGSDGRNGLGAWGAPPNITSDHPPSQMSGSGYHASQNLDHSTATRGSLQGEDRGGASSPRKEQSRASTDNWRSRDLSSGAGDAAPVLQDHWRSSGSLGSSLAPRQQQDKWGSGRLSNSGGWRPRDAGEESAGGYTGGFSTYGASRGRGQQRSRQPWDNRRNWGDEDRLPEWATDLSHEPARGGSFDASGAFHSPAWSSADDDHGISNGFSVNSYSNSNHYSVSGSGGGYSHSSGNFASGGGSLIATAGGLRARHKSGSVGPGELLSPEPSVSSDVSGLDSGVAGSSVKDSSSRGTSREKSGSSVLNGFHRSTLSRTSSDALHATDPQKRLSEALEVHGDEGPGRPLMNGYGGDSRSDSRSSSHEGSNSPLSSEKGPSQGNLESSRSVPSMLDSPRSRTSCSEEKSSCAGGSASSTVQQVSEEGNADQQQLRQPLGHLEHSKSEPAVPSGLRASNNSVRESESAGPGHSLSSQLLQPSPSLPSSKEEKLRDPELEHMELNADDLVAKLVDEEPKACDPVPNAARRPINITPPAGFLPIPERPPADPHQWYYTDPQQEVQGPFSGLIMTSWYEGGYFGDDLLLRRDCDDKFAKLGDLKRVFGRVPFAPGPPVPPLKMSKLRDSQTPHDAEKEIIRKQAAEKEAFEQALQAYNLQKRIYDRQLEQRQAHVLSALSSLEGWDSLPPETQRNLFMQNILRLGNLPEPVAPTAPSFLLNSSPASAAAALSLLTLPQQVHHQLPQASTVASTDASSLQQQQQHGASSGGGGNIATSLHLNTTLASASIAAAAASSSAAGVGVVQQLQNLPQHSMLAAASSNSNSNTPHLQHLSSSAIPEQQQPSLSLTRDPVRELFDQMSSVTAGQQQKSASPLTTLGVTDSPPVMPPNTAAMPTLAQPTPLHQLLLKLQSDANSNAVPTLPLLPQQLLSASSLASGLQIPLSSSSSAAADAGLNSQLSTVASPATDSRATAALLGTPQQPQPQEDVIQSFMQQLTKMHLQQEQTSTQAATAATSPAADAVASSAAAVMVATEAEEEQTELAPVEEDKRRPTHAKKLQDEKKKADSRAKKDEENATNKKQEDRRKLLEEQKKKEQEEEQKKKALEAKRKEEEKKKKLKQQEDANRRQEEKRRQEEENKRKAEERRREQQVRKQQQQQQEEMRRMALEEERKRMNHVDQDELAEAEVARLQQQQQQQQAAWGNVAAAAAAPTANGAQRTPSLVHIQKVQLEKEKLERERWLKEEEARRQELQREAAEKKKSSSMTLKWANKQESGSSVKSLLQIQAEEEKEIKKRQTRELQENKGNNNNTGTNSGSGRLWGANNQPLSWASRASCNSAPPLSLPNGTPGGKGWSENSGGGSAWSGAAASLGSGFWDTAGSDKSGGRTAAAVAAARAPAKPGVVKGSQVQLQSAAVKQNKNTAKQNLNNKLNMQSNANNAAKVNSKKKGKEEETVKKIFSENVGGPDNEFTDWCSSTLVKLKVTASIDVPTFISFLRDVESPYEVHDYIRSYLGDNAEVREFARGYLERRSEVLNATRQKNLAHDNILGPAPAINPASDAFQEAKKGKQKGKKKVQKVDSGLLGFTIGGKGGDGNTAQ